MKIARTDEIPPGSMAIFPGVDIVDVCVVNVDGNYFAVSNICTHKGAPLNRGAFKGEHIVCPWHKATFHVKDGEHSWPAGRSLRSFKVRVEGDRILIEKPDKNP